MRKTHLKRNDTAEAGCILYLIKPLGIGILTTAEKQSKLRNAGKGLARDWMCTLNTIGSAFSRLAGVKAMTDVTGFGLLGHLAEMASGSGLTARITAHAWARSTTIKKPTLRPSNQLTTTLEAAFIQQQGNLSLHGEWIRVLLEE